MIEKIKQAVDYIQSNYDIKPQVGIVLGSGLGSFTEGMKIEAEISYKDIPNFPVSTVKGHSGKLIFGELAGKKVVAMAGRFHHYEGYHTDDVIFPIRVMKFLGVQTMLISNAAGGLNPKHKVGDLMIINDHISFFTPNPLVGKNNESFGPRFPDMSEPYSRKLILMAKNIAAEINLEITEGVYCSVTGPTFETPAEYKMMMVIGVDAVGMSTVQEVIAARHMDLPVFGMSVITDLGNHQGNATITHEEVLQAAKDAEPKLTHIFTQIIARL